MVKFTVTAKIEFLLSVHCAKRNVTRTAKNDGNGMNIKRKAAKKESAIENVNEHSQVHSLSTSMEMLQTENEEEILDEEKIYDIEQPD